MSVPAPPSRTSKSFKLLLVVDASNESFPLPPVNSLTPAVNVKDCDVAELPELLIRRLVYADRSYDFLKSGNDNKEFYETTNQNFLNIPPEESIQIPPSLLISINKPQEIDLGNRKLRLEAFPSAHTNNDLIVVDINTKTAWLADLMFTERTPSMDGDIHGWINALEKIEKSNYEVIIPGHGTPPTNNNKAIRKIKSYLELLRNEIRQAIDDGMDLQDALDTIARSEKNKWELFDVQNARNINMVYPIMEWE